MLDSSLLFAFSMYLLFYAFPTSKQWFIVTRLISIWAQSAEFQWRAYVHEGLAAARLSACALPSAGPTGLWPGDKMIKDTENIQLIKMGQTDPRLAIICCWQRCLRCISIVTVCNSWGKRLRSPRLRDGTARGTSRSWHKADSDLSAGWDAWQSRTLEGNVSF